MILLSFLCMCLSLISGEISQEFFTRQKNVFDLTNGDVSRVSCAISCLNAKKCLSYNVHTKENICEASDVNCGQQKAGMVCYNRESTSGLEKSTTEEARRDYLLFIPNYLPGHSVRKLEIDTGSVTEYTGLLYENALSGTVMPLSRKLLLCIGIPYEIITFSLDSQKKTTLRKVHAVAMAVDEKRKFVFVSPALNSRGVGKIFRMTTVGRGFKKIGKRSELVYNLMTDVKHHKLYIVYDGSINAVDYVTWAEETIVTDKSLRSVTLDPVRGALYYSQAYFLMGITLLDRKTRKLVNMWNEPTGLEYYKNNVYVVSSGRVNFEKIKNVHSRHASIKFPSIKKAGKRPLMLIVNI